MGGDDPEILAADGLRRFHEAVLLRGQHRSAHHPGIAGNNDHGDGEHGVGGAGSEHGHHGEGEDEPGDGHHGVHEPLEHEVQTPFPVARDETDDHAHARADAHREQANPQRDAASVDHAAQHVPPDVVRAEWMGPARRRQPDLGLGGEGIVGREHVGEDRGEDDGEDEGRRDHAQRLALDHGPQRPAPADLGEDGLVEGLGGRGCESH